MNLKFIDQPAHSAIGLGSSIRAFYPLSKQLNLKWELSTYHSGKDKEFWGGSNMLKIDMMITKRLFFNVMHQYYYYHNREIQGAKKYTSIMQFGVSYKY